MIKFVDVVDAFFFFFLGGGDKKKISTHFHKSLLYSGDINPEDDQFPLSA